MSTSLCTPGLSRLSPLPSQNTQVSRRDCVKKILFGPVSAKDRKLGDEFLNEITKKQSSIYGFDFKNGKPSSNVQNPRFMWTPVTGRLNLIEEFPRSVTKEPFNLSRNEPHKRKRISKNSISPKQTSPTKVPPKKPKQTSVTDYLRATKRPTNFDGRDIPAKKRGTEGESSRNVPAAEEIPAASYQNSNI